jgi:transmembrane sensor
MKAKYSAEEESTRAEAAAEWLVKLEALGEVSLSPEDLQAWDDWAADDANRAAFDELAVVRRRLKSIPRLPWPTTEELLNDSHAHDTNHVSVLGQRPSHRVLKFAMAVGVAAVIIGMSAWMATRSDSPTAGPIAKIYTTSVAERRHIELPDGTAVVLGGASSLSVRYGARQRNVNLDRGEALFNVVRDATKPFRVLAGDGAITALGTKFNVRHAEQRVVVTVTEGLVEVAPRAAKQMTTIDDPRWLPVRLARDQAMSYGSEGQASAVERADSKIATAWSRGTLAYRRRPLSDVVGDITRYWPHDIVLEPGTEGLMYTGTVGERNIRGWILGLPAIFPVRVEQPDAERIVIKLREP